MGWNRKLLLLLQFFSFSFSIFSNSILFSFSHTHLFFSPSVPFILLPFYILSFSLYLSFHLQPRLFLFFTITSLFFFQFLSHPLHVFSFTPPMIDFLFHSLATPVTISFSRSLTHSCLFPPTINFFQSVFLYHPLPLSIFHFS